MAVLRPLLCLLVLVLAGAVVAAPAQAQGHGGAYAQDDWSGGASDWDDDWPEEDWGDVPTGGAVPAAPTVELPTTPVEQLPGALPSPAAPAPPQTPTVNVTGGRAANVPYGALIAATARRNNLPVALFTALVRQESAFNARARSHAGARGLTQLMPATARGLGVTKPYDPAQALSGGARYLRAQLTRFGNKRHALAAYNAGPGAVARFKGIPPYAETRTYVKRILAYEAEYLRAGVR